MNELRATQPSADQPSSFLDADGQHVPFNFHRIKHRGESLATIATAIPAVWKDPIADRRAYVALRRWIEHRDEKCFLIFLLASVRALPVVAWSKNWGGDHNGDNIAIAIEAAYYEILSWPQHDPGYGDENVSADDYFYKPIKPAEIRNFLTFYYIRWVRRAASNAISVALYGDDALQRRKKLKGKAEPPKYRQWKVKLESFLEVPTGEGTRRVPEPWKLSYDLEIGLEIDHGLKGWAEGKQVKSWLADWLGAAGTNPIKLRILKLKAAGPWRTRQQIVDIVNGEFGTTFTHDKVRVTLLEAEKELKDRIEFRWTDARAHDRAAGVAPIEPPAASESCELQIGKIEAAAQYLLDEDGYKIGPNLLFKPTPPRFPDGVNSLRAG